MASLHKLGRCRLCFKAGDLCLSHFVPKALYRLVMAGSSRKNRHPLQITAVGFKQTSKQAMQFLLCSECEQRFNRDGENWILKHCYRGRGVFRLRDHLKSSSPVYSSSDAEVYSAAQVPNVLIDDIVYFALSVIWRAAVVDWLPAARRYEAISLGKYEEEIRQYLLRHRTLPERIAVGVMISGLETPVLAFNFPGAFRVDACHCYRFHIPGITFVVSVGKEAQASFGDSCIARSSLHPIIIGKDGDRFVQREIMGLMGKVAPPWGEYPLVNGVERS